MMQKEIQQYWRRMINRKGLLLVIVLLISQISFGQGPTKTSLNYHHLKSTGAYFNALAAIATDTLELPFFDDFAYKGSAPDIRIWADNKVFVNNTFSENQITRGIATFDHLDEFGVPYNFLSVFASSYADTLTSQFIDLKDNHNSIPFNISDSIYLSFFVEKGGLGDVPDTDDSLILQFADNNSIWRTVWSIAGGARTDFEQYFVPVLDANYLYNTFQFRFINYVKNTGNMNHFHLDYVQMQAGRSVQDTISDLAFSRELEQLLLDYTVMPYSHFLENPALQVKASRNAYIFNNSKIETINTDIQVYAENEQLDTFQRIEFSIINNFNVLPDQETVKSYSSPSLLGLIGETPKVRSIFTLDFNRSTITPGEYEAINDNNVIESTQEFNHFYAYDDGSAEAGFALDYNGLPSGPGYTAMRFNIAKKDTLQGVDIHFNKALEEVGTRPITLMFWKEIANGAGKTDQVLYEITTTPKYVNEKNGFARFELDTLIILDAGEFYVGWKQNSDFIINVGWDENYRYRNTTASNPNIFYDLLGSWQALPASGFEGVLMMRPLIGKPPLNPASIPDAEIKDLAFTVYPNPSEGAITIEAENTVSYKIVDMNGRTVTESSNELKEHKVQINIAGLYICILFDKQNKITKTTKIVIN